MSAVKGMPRHAMEKARQRRLAGRFTGLLVVFVWFPPLGPGSSVRVPSLQPALFPGRLGTGASCFGSPSWRLPSPAAAFLSEVPRGHPAAPRTGLTMAGVYVPRV